MTLLFMYFCFSELNKPAKFIKASIVYNKFISAHRRSNHFRYVLYIDIYFIPACSTDSLLFCLLMLEFNLELKSYFSLMFILLKVTKKL